MSLSVQRARVAIVDFLTARAMACTPARSSGLAAGNPASMMSTPSASSCFARRKLLVGGHPIAGGLLAIAQRGVEDMETFMLPLSLSAPTLEVGRAGKPDSFRDAATGAKARSNGWERARLCDVVPRECRAAWRNEGSDIGLQSYGIVNEFSGKLFKRAGIGSGLNEVGELPEPAGSTTDFGESRPFPRKADRGDASRPQSGRSGGVVTLSAGGDEAAL